MPSLTLLLIATVGSAVAGIDARQQTTLVTSPSSISSSETSTTQTPTSRSLTSNTITGLASSSWVSAEEQASTEHLSILHPTMEISVSLPTISQTSASRLAINSRSTRGTSTSQISTGQLSTSGTTSAQPSSSLAIPVEKFSEHHIAHAHALAHVHDTPRSYDEAVTYGTKAIEKMALDPTKATDLQSKWTEPILLHEHKWTMTTCMYTSGDTSNYKKAAQHLGITTETDNPSGDQNEGFRLANTVFMQKPKDEISGEYTYQFDHNFNVIFSNTTHPINYIDKDSHELSRWPDVTFLAWKQYIENTLTSESLRHERRDTQPHLKNLKGIVRTDVKKATAFIVTQIFKPSPASIDGAWPGTSVVSGSDGFKALMGTPEGHQVAMFLAQHKKQLGWKTVEQIQVSCTECGKDAKWWMVFSLKEMP